MLQRLFQKETNTVYVSKYEWDFKDFKHTLLLYK